MHHTTKIKGLILCGGYSTRMQEDKSKIAYHGMPQWQYLAQLLATLVPEVYISCRADQLSTFESYDHIIVDTVSAKGPAAGILSAHEKEPDTAWLVVACDMPLLSTESIKYLLAHRDASKAATTFVSPVNHLAEPLITIWEPAALNVLKSNVENGVNCPRKTLLNIDIELLKNPQAEEQFNANTPEDKNQALNSTR